MPIDERTKELIAIGASVTANCQPCIEYHVAKATELCVDPQDIHDAIDVGKLVRKGAAANMDKHILHVLHDPAAADAPGAKCSG